MRMKMVRDRRKSSQIVEASVEIHGEQVAADLEEFFADKLEEGEVMPSFVTVLTLLRRLLAQARQHLVGSAAEHLKQLDSDDKARRRRNELSRRLETKGRRIRNVLDNMHGPRGALEIAGLDRRVAQEPVDLLAQTERIIERLSAGDLATDSPDLEGFEMNPEVLVENLRPDYQELSGLVEELNREDRKFEATLVAKDEAQGENDRIFRLAGGILAAFYSLAGHEELAQRVVPSTRRAGRTQADVETQEQGSARRTDPDTESTESEAAS